MIITSEELQELVDIVTYLNSIEESIPQYFYKLLEEEDSYEE